MNMVYRNGMQNTENLKKKTERKYCLLILSRLTNHRYECQQLKVEKNLNNIFRSLRENYCVFKIIYRSAKNEGEQKTIQIDVI